MISRMFLLESMGLPCIPGSELLPCLKSGGILLLSGPLATCTTAFIPDLPFDPSDLCACDLCSSFMCCDAFLRYPVAQQHCITNPVVKNQSGVFRQPLPWPLVWPLLAEYELLLPWLPRLYS